MFDTAFTPDSVLEGAYDLEARVAEIPPSYLVKGMFCTRFIELLGADYAAVAPSLVAAPRGGRYVPFKDYPQSDYTRLASATASKCFPALTPREAIRQVAREDLAVFASSMIGKIVLGLAGDARTTLLRIPDAYARVAPGATVRAEDLDARTTRVAFEGYRGVFEYTLGQLEGVVLSFKGRPKVTLRELGADWIAFDVVHGG